MSGTQQITYAVSFGARSKGRNQNGDAATYASAEAIPRIARLLALAIRIDGLVRQQAVPDYAAVARLGWVTRARMTQIMMLLNLAPDIQEEILSWAHAPPGKISVRETSIRTLSSEVIWSRQREQWKHWFAEQGRRNAGRPV